MSPQADFLEEGQANFKFSAAACAREFWSLAQSSLPNSLVLTIWQNFIIKRLGIFVKIFFGFKLK
ncbi:MAG: hypothetical protein IJT59_03410 [Desulfovibrionaceae bacterium]|nr:hypothetical protein [Desulfovibrionaceae bacterium]